MQRILDRIRSLALGIRRIVIGFIGFLLVAILTVVLLAPTALSDIINGISPGVRLIALIALYGVAVFLAYQEFWLGESRHVKGLVVKSPGGALTALSVDSVHERIVDVVSEINDVQTVNAKVTEHRGKADIELNVIIGNDEINLPEKKREITKALDGVQKQLGLQLSERPVVEIMFADGTKPVVTQTEDPHERRRGFGHRQEKETATPSTPLASGTSDTPTSPETSHDEADEVDIYKVIGEVSQPSSGKSGGGAGETDDSDSSDD